MKANKTTGRESKMTLARLITDAKIHISATVEKLTHGDNAAAEGKGVESCRSRIPRHTKPR
jgi:hypothetical protein